MKKKCTVCLAGRKKIIEHILSTQKLLNKVHELRTATMELLEVHGGCSSSQVCLVLPLNMQDMLKKSRCVVQMHCRLTEA